MTDFTVKVPRGSQLFVHVYEPHQWRDAPAKYSVVFPSDCLPADLMLGTFCKPRRNRDGDVVPYTTASSSRRPEVYALNPFDGTPATFEQYQTLVRLLEVYEARNLTGDRLLRDSTIELRLTRYRIDLGRRGMIGLPNDWEPDDDGERYGLGLKAVGVTLDQTDFI